MIWISKRLLKIDDRLLNWGKHKGGASEKRPKGIIQES